MTSVTFSPLPGTAEEARALSRIMPAATVLIRGAATETALKQAHGPQILHVATHGFFLSDQPQVKNGDYTRSRDIFLVPAQLGAGAENPLLRAGLALAGANRLTSGSEDGILTALEASALDLIGTRLVVLSACETGVGKVQIGEGVYGLRRALVLAGAESQVMSLWQVEDTATKDLMVGFYRRLFAGEGRTEALRQTQLEMLNRADRAHPYFWASFISIGDWRPLKRGLDND